MASLVKASTAITSYFCGGAGPEGPLCFEISDGPAHPRLRAVIAGGRVARLRIQQLGAVIDCTVNQLASRRVLIGVRRIVDAEHSIVIADRKEIALIFPTLLIGQVPR